MYIGGGPTSGRPLLFEVYVPDYVPGPRQDQKLEKMKNELTKLYQSLYELTQPVCQTKCSLPQSCCSPEYCEFAIKWAKAAWGKELERTDHPRLPLMGPHGCTAMPFARPMCTAHVCEMTLYKQGKDYWKRYWDLRNQINDIEWQVFQDVRMG